jgi:hypothetical protein
MDKAIYVTKNWRKMNWIGCLTYHVYQIGMYYGSLFQRKRTWEWCYDFKNIFAEKFVEKIGVFDSKQS